MDEVCALVRKFQLQLRETLRMDERMKRISANVGIAHSTGGSNVDDLIIKSGLALAEAEKHGGGKYTIYRGRI
jgi:GGDEF domain-containing protein